MKIVKTDPPTPLCLLILGTDASGKNHVANIIAAHLEEQGHGLEKREGSFSAPASQAVSSEDKGGLSLIKEALFIRSYPLLRPLIYPVLNVLLKRDLAAFRRTGHTLLVISNTVLRVLAFHLGHVYDSPAAIRLPTYLHKTLQAIHSTTRALTLVLDVEHAVRAQRVQGRLQSGKADYFDRYLAADSELSERIEEILIWLATTYLGARVVMNNDLSKAEIIAITQESLAGGKAE